VFDGTRAALSAMQMESQVEEASSKSEMQVVLHTLSSALVAKSRAQISAVAVRA
jgi:hypothetical protein